MMTAWSNGSESFLSDEDVALASDFATLDLLDLNPGLGLGDYGELEWEADAPYDTSHPRHRDYCSGCPACDRDVDADGVL